MRKILIVAALLAGAGLLAAQASQDETNLVRENSSQPSTRTDDVRPDGERARATRDDRTHENRRLREEQKEAREEEEDGDRD